MSALIDRFRKLGDKLMTGDFTVPAKLYRYDSRHDPRTDKASLNVTVIECRAVLGPHKTYTAAGMAVNETAARLNAKPTIGDVLKIGPAEYTIKAVEEIAPDGDPILWIGVLK